jgi:hypothetical protein
MNYLRLFTIFIILILTPVVRAELKPGDRNILVNEAKAIDLRKVLAMNDSWITLPGYDARDFWNKLPEEIRKEYISKATNYLKYDWPVVKATDYLEFIRSGERKQEVYAACSEALNSLVLGELVEGKGRFMDQIINGVWFYCEQTWWGWSAHLGSQKAGAGLPDINDPFIDLGVGEIACDLSWTYYLLHKQFDRVHPLISQRLKQEIEKKVLIPYLNRNDFWYMGFNGGRPNNWNPWINYNMLNCYLLIENDPERRYTAIEKILSSMDKFLNGYSDDGGCDEGPSYWGAAGALLYESMEIMKNATSGKFDVFNDQLIRNIGKYFYKVNIHSPYFINFADADATTTGDASTVYRYGKAIGDTIMEQFGAYLGQQIHFGEHSFDGKICDQIKSLTISGEIKNAVAREALVSHFWLPETEVGGARDNEGSYSGFFFGAKGGFNDESHNHNDVGSCVLYYDGKPCLIDLGREEYNAKTFSPRRYEIWTMQSGYHNLPVINGTDQMAGKEFKAKNSAFRADKKTAVFTTDIAGAYTSKAMVKKWVRTYILKRGKSFEINDDFELSSSLDAPTSSNLITNCKVTEISPGLLELAGEGFTLKLKYDKSRVKPEIEFIPVKDITLRHYWPAGVTRIRFLFQGKELKGTNSLIFTPER